MPEDVAGFKLDDVPIIKAFIEFEIEKNERGRAAWKRKESWFNNPAFPGEFKKRIKALKKVKEIADEYEKVKEADDNVKKYGFTEKPRDVE